MANIKDMSKIREKWTRVTPQRPEDYAIGVQDPKRDWASATKEAEKRYSEGVQKSIQRGAFGKGVSAAGTQKWQQRSLSVGPNRFAEGVAASGDAYEQGFSPYAQTIASTSLPPRFPKGDPRNLERVKAIAVALRNKKEQQG